MRTHLLKLGCAFACLGIVLHVVHRRYDTPPTTAAGNTWIVQQSWRFDGIPPGAIFAASLPASPPRQQLISMSTSQTLAMRSAARISGGTRMQWHANTGGAHTVGIQYTVRVPERNRTIPPVPLPKPPADTPDLTADVFLPQLYDRLSEDANLDPEVVHRQFVDTAKSVGLMAKLARGLRCSQTPAVNCVWAEVYLNKRWYAFDCVDKRLVDQSTDVVLLQRGKLPLTQLTGPDGVELPVPTPMITVENRARALPGLYKRLGFSRDIATAFILFPVCALLICMLRNVLGMVTFGIFMPMLVAAACHLTGLAIGLPVFFAGIGLAAVMHGTLKRRDTITVARRAAVISFLTILLLGAAAIGFLNRGAPKGVMLFLPVVLLTTTAETLHKLVSKRHYVRTAQLALCSMAAICACYFVFHLQPLADVLLRAPELLLVVLGLQIAAGAIPSHFQQHAQKLAARLIPWLATPPEEALPIDNSLPSD